MIAWRWRQESVTQIDNDGIGRYHHHPQLKISENFMTESFLNISPGNDTISGFKTSDHAKEQGVESRGVTYNIEKKRSPQKIVGG